MIEPLTIIILIFSGLILSESLAYLVYLTKAPVARKRVLEFLLYRKIKPYPASSMAASQIAAPRYFENPFTVWSLNPEFQDSMGNLIHNSQGFRHDGEFEQLDHDGLKIYCAGDSTTYGTDTDNNKETWPHLLQEYLNERQDNLVQVINGGVGGFNTFQCYIRLSAYIEYLDPDIVIVYLTKNDLTPFYNSYPVGGPVLPDLSNAYRSMNFDNMAVSINPLARWSFLGKLWAIWRMTTREINLSYCYGPIKPPDVESMLESKTDFSIIETMHQNMVDLCSGRGITLVYMTQRVIDPMFNAYVDRINDHIRTLHNPQKGCFVLDLDREFSKDPHLYIDKLHFGQQGNRKAAEFVGEFVTRNNLLIRSGERIDQS